MVFKKQILQAANTDLFNPLVSKAHIVSEYTIFLLSQLKSVKANY